MEIYKTNSKLLLHVEIRKTEATSFKNVNILLKENKQDILCEPNSLLKILVFVKTDVCDYFYNFPNIVEME
jgi:hypothetical protein